MGLESKNTCFCCFSAQKRKAAKTNTTASKRKAIQGAINAGDLNLAVCLDEQASDQFVPKKHGKDFKRVSEEEAYQKKIARLQREQQGCCACLFWFFCCCLGTC